MSGTANPFGQFIEGRLLGALLKSGSTTVYYDILEVDKRATEADISRAYKKGSVRLHPDKIQQTQHRAPTEKEKEDLQKLKKAYQILSNADRRKKFDSLGQGGLAILEGEMMADPQNMFLEILRNFKTNSSDKYTLALLLMLALATVVAAPVLFCLKLDATLDAATTSNSTAMADTAWALVWLPLWVIDFFLLVGALSALLPRRRGAAKDFLNARLTDSGLGEDGGEESNSGGVTWLEAGVSLTSTLAHISFQVLLVLKLDDNAVAATNGGSSSSSSSSSSWVRNMTYFEMMAPLLLYEACYLFNLLQVQAQKAPDTEAMINEHQSHMRDNAGSVDEADVEAAAAAGAGKDGEQTYGAAMNDEMLLQKLMRGHETQRQIYQARWSIVFNVLDCIFLCFVAAKLDATDGNGVGVWDWAVVFIPLYVYLFCRVVAAYWYQRKGDSLGEHLSGAMAQDMGDVTIYASGFYQEALWSQGKALKFCTIWPLLVIVLVVLLLQGEDISAFTIFIPVWVWLGVILCVVCCCCTLISYTTPESLEEEWEKEQKLQAQQAELDMAVSAAAASGGGTFVQTPWKQNNSPSEESSTSRVAAEEYQAPQLSPSAQSDVDAQEPGNIALSATAVAVTVAVDAGVGADSASRASPPSGSEGDSQKAEQLPTAPMVADGIGDID